MNKYIEAIASVTAVQFWNTESCMIELKELGVNPINIRIQDGTPRLIITSTLIGEMEASEGDYIAALEDADGMMIVAPKQLFEEKYRVFEASKSCDENTTESKTPAIDYPGNRRLYAFTRNNDLNEIYSTEDVDQRGIPVNYSIWRGNHSIMGMTGILFQKGLPGDPDEQEGVEDVDLLEMVYDRVTIWADYLEGSDNCLLDTALLNIENAIRNLYEYKRISSESSDGSDA